MLRSCTYPVPGFGSFTSPSLTVDPVNDPTPDPFDLYNTSFRLLGRSCPWDLSVDGNVGVNDFLAMLAAWGPHPVIPADFDGDGMVGVTDFLILLAHWGPCTWQFGSLA